MEEIASLTLGKDMGVIIDFQLYKKAKMGKKETVLNVENYKDYLNKLSFFDLNKEMSKFKELQANKPNLTDEDYLKGIALFRIIVAKATTEQMQKYAKECFNILTIEYAEGKKTPGGDSA